MCGIIACLIHPEYNRPNLTNKLLMDGIIQLQNRGYDSAGISYIDYSGSDFKIKTIKRASKNDATAIELLQSNIVENYAMVGISHTRWATHGAKNDTNSHPHNSNDNKISIVHNGIIENYAELKHFLQDNGFTFYSQTDSEVIVNMISYFYNNKYSANKYSTKDPMTNAIRETINKLEGTYGIAIINSDTPSQLYCVANGSPLLVSKSDDFVMIASEISGFCNYFKSYITLKHDDILTIYYDDQENVVEYKTLHQYESTPISQTNYNLTPDPFPNWTLKEIFEQTETIQKSINFGGRILDNSKVKLGGLDQCVDVVKKIEHLILIGCGTSEHSALYASHTFKRICSFTTVQVFNGSEFSYEDIPKKGIVGIIFISQSGETKDIHRCIEVVKDTDIITIGVINVIDSLIARLVDCGVYCNAGREVAVASTKSFTSQAVCLQLIAIWFSNLHGVFEIKRIKIIKDLHNLSADFENTLNMVQPIIKTIAREMMEKDSIFILGKGTDESIAKEGSLKIKELSYIHSEGYSATALKHGPFALLNENLPVILIDNTDFKSKIMNSYQEIISRNSPVYFITSETVNLETPVIQVEQNNSFQSILNNIPLQLLAYYISVYKGIHPDTPKNLAKVVTVE